MPSAIVTITKLEAAKRQLHMAIKLWFADADAVSVHTLACAAHQIVHDINSNRKGSDLLLDSALIKDEFRRDYVNEMRKAMNFFKHADNDPDTNGLIEFPQAITALFILFSIIGIERFGEPIGETSVAFLLFYATQNPHLIARELRERFKLDDLVNLPAVSKKEFLGHFLEVRGRNARA